MLIVRQNIPAKTRAQSVEMKSSPRESGDMPMMIFRQDFFAPESKIKFRNFLVSSKRDF
jgi:hypothetical protein